MQIRGKKGVSDVVSTVLMILIVVAAVAIISVIVINLTRNMGTSTDSTLKCQKLDMIPLSCNFNDSGYVSLEYKRGNLGADVGINKLESLWYNTDGGSSRFDETVILAFEKKSNNHTLAFNPVSLSLLSTIDAKGQPYVCPETNRINCVNGTQYTPPAPTPVNGVCGATLNSCTAGTLSDNGDSATHYRWDCVGISGGTTASCSQIKLFTLTLTSGSPGNGNNITMTSPFYYGCTSSSCVVTPTISAGTSVTIIAYANSTTSNFGSWSGSACTGTANPCTFTIGGNYVINAQYTAVVAGGGTPD